MPTLEVHAGGAGEPLVLVHGIGSCWQVWKPVLPALEARHRVLAVDLPGYGQSPPVRGEPSVTALVDAVQRELDAAGLDAPHLVGNSLGGWVAAELAARGRARSVVAISPAGLWTRREFAYSDVLLWSTYVAAQRLAPHADRIAATAPGRRLLFGHVCARPGRMDTASAAWQVRAFAASPSYLGTLRWMRHGPRMPAGLERIACPFRVVWGTLDLLLPYRQARRWERIVPGAERVALPRLGHTPMADDPDLVARAILELTSG